MKSGKEIINKPYIQCDSNYGEILHRKKKMRKNWGNGGGGNHQRLMLLVLEGMNDFLSFSSSPF